MPRSATDATRFTSTTPHASTKPAPNRPLNSLPQQRPGPAGETPQEKIRRLRAAADKARDAQVSTFDKVILRGRVWADRAHRFAALSLIGITVIAGGVTVYALGDMMIHNRKKRAEYFSEQKALHAAAIHNAKMAIESGNATEEQLEFINREEEEEARIAMLKVEGAQKKGIFKRGKEWLFAGLKKEEVDEDVGIIEKSLGYEELREEEGIGKREGNILRAIEGQATVKDKVKQAFADEKERQRVGGPLDRLGTSATGNTGPGDEPPKSGGWTSWMTRR